MQNSTMEVREIEIIENNRRPSTDSNDSRKCSTSSISKTSSTRHSMEARPESPASSKHETISAGAPNATVDHNALPAYSENKNGSGIVRRMSKKEYATEISKMMGKQLVKSVNGKTSVKAAEV